MCGRGAAPGQEPLPRRASPARQARGRDWGVSAALVVTPGGPKAHLQSQRERVGVPGREPIQGWLGHFQAGQRRTCRASTSACDRLANASSSMIRWVGGYARTDVTSTGHSNGHKKKTMNDEHTSHAPWLWRHRRGGGGAGPWAGPRVAVEIGRASCRERVSSPV